MKKEEILARLLIKNDEVKNYVTLLEDYSGRYLKYAFINGYPDNFNKLPVWSKELPANDGKIYEISGFTGDHWAFKDTKPVDVDKLLGKKFELSVNDICELIQK